MKKWYVISKTNANGQVEYYRYNYRSLRAQQYLFAANKSRARQYREKEIGAANEMLRQLQNKYTNHTFKLEVA